MRKSGVLKFIFLGVLALVFYWPHNVVQAGDIEDILALLNNARNSAGVHSLTMNSQLNAAAQRHSSDMAAGDFLSHTGSDGSSAGQRVSDTGYNWTMVGENILFRFDTSGAGAFDQWWNSPPHQANMMNAGFCDIGLARAFNAGSGRYYYTMVLGIQSGQNCSAVFGPNVPSGSASVAIGGVFQDMRWNPTHLAAPVTAYCTADGAAVFDIANSAGVEAFRVTRAQMAAALAQAVASQRHVLIAQGLGNSLYALWSNEFQLVGVESGTGKVYNFIAPATICGDLSVTVSAGPAPSGAGARPPATTASVPADCIHVVRAGENLFRLSLRYGTTVQAFASLNNIADPARIFVNQRLLIPNC